MAQRLLALLGAVAIVLAAIAVRAAIDGDDTDRARSDTGAGEVILICARDLAEACTGLSGVTVIVDDAATTAEQIETGSLPAGADAWLTTSVWTEVAEARAPAGIEGQTAIATSPVVIAVDPTRTDALTTLCGDVALWRCIGDATGNDWGSLGGDARWGSFRVGLPSASSATGLGVLASVASGYFGSTDFARNDFDTTTFPSWLDGLTAPSGAGELEPVDTLVTVRGRYTAVGDVGAAANDRAVEVLIPTPTIDVTAVIATFPGADDLGDIAAVRAALLDAGWTTADSAEAPATLQVPGVLAALHSLWADVSR